MSQGLKYSLLRYNTIRLDWMSSVMTRSVECKASQVIEFLDDRD